MKKIIVNEITAPFLAAIGGKKKNSAPGLLVYFKNRSYGGQPFPREMFDDLRGDPVVDCICDADTGEVLFPEI